MLIGSVYLNAKIVISRRYLSAPPYRGALHRVNVRLECLNTSIHAPRGHNPTLETVEPHLPELGCKYISRYPSTMVLSRWRYPEAYRSERKSYASIRPSPTSELRREFAYHDSSQCVFPPCLLLCIERELSELTLFGLAGRNGLKTNVH